MKVEQVLENPSLDIALSPHYRMRLALSVYGLSQSARLTLICIAEAANFNKYDGACWYAQDTIASEAGLTRETVSRAYKELIFRGLIGYTPQTQFPGYGGYKPGASKSRKVYLNLDAMIEQADPPNGDYYAYQYKQYIKQIQEARKDKRSDRKNRKSQPVEAGVSSSTHIEPKVAEPVAFDSQTPPPDFVQAAPAEVAPVSDQLTATGKSELNPWYKSNDQEAERARQMEALASRYGTD